MTTMSKLFVQVSGWNNDNQSFEPVGTVIYDNDPEHRLGFTGFVYDRDYLKAGGSALDPVNLKTTENDGRFVFSTDGTLPSYFQQFLPGTFADALLTEKVTGWGELNEAEKLYLLTEINGDFGAIQLNSHLNNFDKPLNTTQSLKELVEIVRDFQQGRSTPELDETQLRNLCAYSKHKPKIEFMENVDAPRSVVKLNAIADINDAKVSHFLSEQQRKAGIDVVPVELIELPGEDVLVSKAYDRSSTPDDDGNIAMHNRLSVKTLLSNSDQLKMSEVPSYAHAANAIRSVSSKPESDVNELYRRAMFSALTAHTTNGLDNIEMVESRPGQWRLAPSFNNVPSMSPVESFDLSFSGKKDSVSFCRPDIQFAMKLGESMGMDATTSLQNAAKVATTLASIKEPLLESSLGARECTRILKSVKIDAAMQLQAQIVQSPVYRSAMTQTQGNAGVDAGFNPSSGPKM